MILILLLAAIAGAEEPANGNDAEATNRCDLRIQQLKNIDFSNDPFPSATFRVRRQNDASCPFFLTIDNGGAPSFSTRRLLHSDHYASLKVQICGDASCSRIIKHFPEASSSSDVITGQFAPHGADEIELSFRPRLDTADYERFGTYDSTFAIRLYSGTPGGENRLLETDNFRLSHRLNKRIDLSLVSTGLPFDAGSTTKTLNFGALTTGKSQGFDFILKYNAGYRVRFSSQNRGALQGARKDARIPYVMTIDGMPVYLGDDEERTWLRAPGVSPRGGRRFTGRVVIGRVDQAQAGSYQDAITITVSATE